MAPQQKETEGERPTKRRDKANSAPVITWPRVIGVLIVIGAIVGTALFLAGGPLGTVRN